MAATAEAEGVAAAATQGGLGSAAKAGEVTAAVVEAVEINLILHFILSGGQVQHW